MRRPFRAAALAAISILGGLTMFGPAQSPSANPVRSDQQVLDELVNYRSWKKVTDEPIVVPGRSELLAGSQLDREQLLISAMGWTAVVVPVRPEKQPEVKKTDSTNPISTAKTPEIRQITSILLTEQRTYGVVFVNKKGLKSFNDAERTTAFPEGSIIVRETRSAPDGIPGAVIVMFKRAKGFNPKGGDWEFVNLESPQIRIRQRQTTGSCLDCHSIREKHDFVFGKGEFPGHNGTPKSGVTP